MKIIYLDCFSGISGDMTLGAFVDLDIDFKWLRNELLKVHLHGYELVSKKTVKNGITGTKIDVLLTDHDHHSHNSLSEILHLIEQSHISEGAKDIASRIFWRLARAEAEVHGSSPEEVHFHEVGAVDSIVDIVGCAICVDKLAPDKIYAAPMCDGSGFVRCQHGLIPVPVPAVCQLVKDRGVQLKTRDVQGELITPTGAAILCELAEDFCPLPQMKVTHIGYGAGTKDFDFPNMLRIYMGEESDEQDVVWLLETNLDDMTGEAMGYAMEQLFEGGALDVYYTPIFMKKNRPAYMLCVICNNLQQIEQLIFEHTSTLGIRKTMIERSVATREFADVNGCRFKVWQIGDIKKYAPEYEDVVRLAREKNMSFSHIYNELVRNYEAIYCK